MINLLLLLNRFVRYCINKKLDWVIGAISLIALWVTGNKSAWGPAISIVNQVGWIYYAYRLKQRGLLYTAFIFLIIHIRNFILWL